MREIHELFVLALFLVWFAGATPDIEDPWPLHYMTPPCAFYHKFLSKAACVVVGALSPLRSQTSEFATFAQSLIGIEQARSYALSLSPW